MRSVRHGQTRQRVRLEDGLKFDLILLELPAYGHHHPDYQRQAAENIGRRPQDVRVIKGRF